MKKIYTLTLTLLIGFTLIACASDKSSQESKAPAFTLKDQQGNEIKLADFSGKVIILDFWATWCSPCRKEIPHFIELQNEYGSEGLQVIGISVDQKGWGVVKPFMKEQGINYPILMTDQTVYKAYQELLPPAQRGGVPFTFIIDRQGIVRDQFVGYRNKSFFKRAVKPLL